MFLIPYGMKLGSGVTVRNYIARSMVPVAIGNIISAAFFLAGGYALCYGETHFKPIPCFVRCPEPFTLYSMQPSQKIVKLVLWRNLSLQMQQVSPYFRRMKHGALVNPVLIQGAELAQAYHESLCDMKS